MRGVFLVGPPGAGKTTQGALLAQSLGGVHRSMGELVRAARADGLRLPPPAAITEPARMATVGLILTSIPDTATLLILDGFPRSPGQLAWLPVIAPAGSTIIEIHAPLATCIARMKGRGREGEDMVTIAYRHDAYARAAAQLRDAAADLGISVQHVDGEGDAALVRQRIAVIGEASKSL